MFSYISAVILELKFNSFERGRGLWKFNNTLLTDKIYVDKVKENIERVNIQYDYSDNVYIRIGKTKEVDDSLFLEFLLSISYSSYKKKEQEKMEVSLINDITALESQEQINLELITAKKIKS